MKNLLRLGAMSALHLAAHAQSFNIDFGPPGSAAGVVPSSYGGVLEQPGVWNEFTSGPFVSSPIVDLAGTASGVTMTSQGLAMFAEFDEPGTSGAEENLLDDFLRPDPLTQISFDGLSGNYYEIVLYGWAPDAPLNVSGFNFGGPTTLQTGGAGWPGSLTLGVTHQRLVFTIAGGSFLLRFTDPAGHPLTCNGLQLRELSYESFCYGSALAANGCNTCPCSNQDPFGSNPVGCANSTGGGALLSAFGTPDLSGGQDTLRLSLALAPPNSFALLISGAAALPNNAANPCFGTDSGIQAVALDGLRCVGGGILRHGSRMVSSGGGSVQDWGPPSPPTQGLGAAFGFVPGETRYFQVLYRDDPLTVCGRGLNSTNGLRVTFLP